MELHIQMLASAIVIFCSSASAETGTQTEAKGIEINGKTTSVAPVGIGHVVADPEKEATALIKQGGAEPKGAVEEDGSKSVDFKGVKHAFVAPHQINLRMNTNLFKAGDTIYEFRFENDEKRAAFLKEYDLKNAVVVKNPLRHDVKIYRIAEGKYVVPGVLRQYFICMSGPHKEPGIKVFDKDGKCPECGQNLVSAQCTE